MVKDAQGFNEAAANRRGKPLFNATASTVPDNASMRPRRIAAENRRVGPRRWRRRQASMRPRRIAAENLLSGIAVLGHVKSFNEAAANRRGKRALRSRRNSVVFGFNEAAANRRGKPFERALADLISLASMRPRRIAAENSLSHLTPTRKANCFNEAAANRRGKLLESTAARATIDGFNEAAANRRGKRVLHRHW